MDGLKVFQSYHLRLEGLGIYRMIFVVYMVFVPGIPNFSMIAENPNWIYHPPLSLAKYIPQIPSAIFLESIEYVLWILYTALFLGIWVPFVSIAITVFIIIGRSFWYSFSFIDHYILADVLPMLMAFSGWGLRYCASTQYKIDKPIHTSFSLFLVAYTVGCALFTSGILKFLGGWLDTSNSATWSYNIYYVYSFNAKFVAPTLSKMNVSFLWELGDYIAVILELGFILTILNLKTVRWAALLVLIFHFLNILVLNIAFLPNYMIYMAFLPWDRLSPAIHRRLSNWEGKLTTVHLIGIMLVSIFFKLIVYNILSDNKTTSLLHFGFLGSQIFNMVLALGCITIYFYLLTKKPTKLL